MRAKDVMSAEVMSIAATATAYEASELLVNARVSAMPVVDEAGGMIGIVSEADLLPCVEESEPGAEPAGEASRAVRPRRVVDVMTRDVVTADENAGLREISELMTKHRIKRIPLLRGETVVGIVSRRDLLRGSISRGPLPDMSWLSDEAKVADERLRRAVVAALEGQAWSTAEQTEVIVNNGVVHVWGVVSSERIRTAYREAAENVAGVKGVKVHMHVAKTVAQPGDLPIDL